MSFDADNVLRLDFLEWDHKDVTHYQKNPKTKQLYKWAQQSGSLIYFLMIVNTN